MLLELKKSTDPNGGRYDGRTVARPVGRPVGRGQTGRLKTNLRLEAYDCRRILCYGAFRICKGMVDEISPCASYVKTALCLKGEKISFMI